MVNLEINLALDDASSVQSEGFDAEEMKPIMKSIIITRCREGATIDEILDDYKELTGDSLLSFYSDREAIAEYLRSIDGVWSTFNAPNGPFLWYCNTQKTQHLSNMIKNQKSPRGNRKYQAPRYQPSRTSYVAGSSSSSTMMASSSGTTGQRDKFFEDNINFVPKRNAWNRVQQHQQQRSAVGYHPYLPPQRRPMQSAMMMQQKFYHNVMKQYYMPNFCGYQMIGDDFFLSLARWELGYSFDPGHNIQQSGLCISGLTIAEAADRVMKAPCINDRVIINVGVVDLLHGHDFIDMQLDLLQLMKNCENRGASVILTTLSPVANSSHIPGVVDRLQKFNSMIRNHSWNYIDLWRCFVNENENTLYECFQPGPRHVTGSNQPHVLWNKLGRQRIIKFLKTNLGSFV